MAKKIAEYKASIEGALRSSGRYSHELEAQVISLAGMMRTLEMANEEIDSLDSTTISVVSRYGNETLAPHPVFRIQKDAQDAVTRQMKALSLTAGELSTAADADPLVELTEELRATDGGTVRPQAKKTT